MKKQGNGNAFQRVGFCKIYGNGQDTSSWAVLSAAAEKVGLDDSFKRSEQEYAAKMGYAWSLDEKNDLMPGVSYDIYPIF